MKQIKGILLSGFMLLALFAASAYTESPREDPLQVVGQLLEWEGQYGGWTDAGHKVISDENSWTRLWLSLEQGGAPPLDFTKYLAVAVMAGERPTGGYTVEFSDPILKGMDVTVRYRLKTPTGITTQAIARPWKVRAFPRVKGHVYVEALTNEAPPK